MQCERLLNLSKSWYLNVKDETMAPARMIQFIKNHVATCDVCQEDPDIQEEIEKITEIILPESKIPKAVRLQKEQEENCDDDDEDESDDDTEEEEEEEEEEYMDDDDDDDLDEEDFDKIVEDDD